MAKIVTLVTAAIFGVMFMSDLAHATDEAAKAAPAATAKTGVSAAWLKVCLLGAVNI